MMQIAPSQQVPVAFALAAAAAFSIAAGCTRPNAQSSAHGDEPTSALSSSVPSAAATAAPPSLLEPREHHALAIAAATDGGPARNLVVLLHGVGSSADSFQSIALKLAPSFPRADFLIPDGFHPFDQESDGTGYQWFSSKDVTPQNRAGRVREAGKEVSAWIDSELQKRGLAGDRLVVVGFSQGSIVGAWLAVHRSPSPAAVVMFSGRVADDEAPIAGSVSTPVLMAHGTDDTRIPFSLVSPGAATLEAWGARVTKRIYPGLGHSIDPREMKDAVEFLRTARP